MPQLNHQPEKSKNIFCYTNKSPEESAREFNVDPNQGLGRQEAARRLKVHGENKIESQKVIWWRILLRQLKSSFVYLLIAAGLITLVLQEFIDSGMIALFLLINTFLGFYQEYRSEKIIELLNQYLVSRAKVLRDGKIQEIPSEQIVPGDILILETGAKIPADVRLIETLNIRIDESVLTGESAPVNKNSRTAAKKVSAFYQANNLGFNGTTILNGKAKALVLATGQQSSVGQIADFAGGEKRVSSFEKGIASFSKFIFKLVVCTLIIIIFANILIKGSSLDLVEFAVFIIALIVGVVPEALPLVTTFSLSHGARKLAKQKAVVKRLSAVEDLGGIEVLCTDKTGTLTQNRLTVASVFAENSDQALWYANLAAEFEERERIEPFDLALWHKLSKKLQQNIKHWLKKAEVPFNPQIRRNIVLVQNSQVKSDNWEIITRGASEEVIKYSANLDLKKKKEIEQWVKIEGQKGHRTLAIGRKEIKASPQKLTDFEKNLEKRNDFEFLGAVSFVDPIKKSAFEAVKHARELHVKIKIITGDSPEVAGAVTHRIGLAKSPADVICAAEWEKLPLPEKMIALEKYQVFARVSPEQKYEIIKLLQQKYQVGFLGEGINDTPALKIANVSLVVDGAADIAREAADIILLQKNLKVILSGIREGRRIFVNTVKYIKTTLASNFGNFFALATASLLVDFLPMLPLQILLVNLLSDFPMIAIATDRVDSKELISPKQYDVKNIIIFSVILGLVSTVFDFIFFGLFYKLSPSVLQTNWFIGSILTELVLIFSVRSHKAFFRANRPSRLLLWLGILAVSATIVIPFTFVGQNIFQFTRPSFNYLVLVIAIVVVYFVFSEVVKIFYYKKLNHLKSAVV